MMEIFHTIIVSSLVATPTVVLIHHAPIPGNSEGADIGSVFAMPGALKNFSFGYLEAKLACFLQPCIFFLTAAASKKR